jgi:hypothetical protein
MASADDLARMVPGFDFLQGMLKNASAGLPGMGQWIAPTLNPEELDKRIQELKTVQFWLDQNAKLLGATIQGLEVQKLTLTTLQSMNLPLADLSEALKIKMPSMPAPPPPAPAPRAAAPEPDADDADADGDSAAPSTGRKPAAAPAAPLVDPMQWWGALTQQFSEIAAKAVKDSATDAAMNLAGTLAKAPLKAATKAAAGALKKATGGGAKSAASATKPAAARKRTR